MLLRQLRYFQTVAEEGSVVRAAAKLRVAQPALSRQLQYLEGVVGTPLLDREPRGVRRTPAGTILLNAITPIFDYIDHALSRVHLAGEGRLGTLQIGLGRAAMDSSAVGRALSALRHEFPDVRVVVTEVGSELQAARLRAGDLDIAIGLSGVADADLSSVPLCELIVDSVMLPASHPLGNQGSIRTTQLGGERLLVVDPLVVGPFAELYAAIRRLGVDRWDVHPSAESVYRLVAAGRGWTMASSTLHARPPSGMIVRRLEGLEVPLTLAARFRRGDDSPLVATITPILRQLTSAPAAQPTPARPAIRRPLAAGLEMRHLRALLVTTESGSLSRAAQRLGITPSGLSRQVRSLEREVGVPLLRRLSSGVEPTAAGHVFRAHAARLVTLVENAIAQTRQSRHGIAGHCSIGTVSTELSGDLLVQAIRRLSEEHPDISVDVTEMVTRDQVQGLREKQMHLGIAGANAGVVNDPVIGSLRLREDRIDSALLSEHHRLASRSLLTPADLADVPFIFPDRSVHPVLFDLVMEHFAAIGLVPHIIGAFNGPRSPWRAALDSDGWTIGSRSMRERPLAGRVSVPIDGLSIPSGLQLLYRRDQRDPAVLAVLETFRRLSGSDEDGPRARQGQ